MPSERWADVDGYEGIYKVSDQGNVFSVKRRSPNGNLQGGYLLKPQHYGNGYVFYHLTKNGKTKGKLAHRLVAKAFVDNPNGYPEVNHLDGNKDNNKASNLEWCTRSHNNAHAVRTGLRDIRPMQEEAYKANRKAVVFRFDGREVARFPSMRDAALVSGVNYGSICRCANGDYAQCDGYEVDFE